MQKVVGSSPIIRFKESPAQAGFFVGETGDEIGRLQAKLQALMAARFLSSSQTVRATGAPRC